MLANLNLQAVAKERLPLLAAVGGIASVGGLLWAIRGRRFDCRPKTVLVTGCAMGLGRATAEELMRKGDFVIGTDIDEKGLQTLRDEFPASFYGMKMDVSNAESVAKAAAQLKQYAAKDECLDAIVNNAGIIRGGPMIELSEKDMSLMVGVNIVGPFLVTKQFFPLLRRCKTDAYKPRILNFGSEISYAGVSAMMNGPYAMTKFAIEAYTASLRQELALLEPPAYVVILNPGAHASNMTEKTGTHFGTAAVKSQSKYFSKLLPRMEELAQAYMDGMKHPASELAERVWQLVHDMNPPRRAPINVSLTMEISRLLPQAVLDFFAVNGLKMML